MRYPSLPRIVIPIACTADWNAMRSIEADGRARLCRTCDAPVYDSRSMTRGELHELIVKHEGAPPCLRLHRRPDGTIVTGSCFAPVVRAGRLLWLKVGLAAVAFWSAVFALRSWIARPKPNPTPVTVAATPASAPEAITVTIQGDADRPIEPKKTQRKVRRYHVTMGRGKAGSD
jgi:hypothetical protein